MKKVVNPNGINVRVNRGGSDVLNFEQYGTDEDFELHYGIFDTEAATSVGLIFTFETAQRGEYLLDNVSLKKYDGYPLKIEMVEKELLVRVDQSQALNVNYAPVETFNKDLIWTSEDESIARVDAVGNVTGVGVGTTTIVATSPVDSTVVTKAEVEVHNDDILIDSIKIKNLDDTLNTEEKRFLSVDTEPSYITEEANITWESSNENIAYFEGNKLVAKGAGTVTITATHDGRISDSKDIVVTKRQIDDFAVMRDRWRATLIGTEETMDLSDVDILNYVKRLDENSLEIYETMYKKADRDLMAYPEVWDSVATTFEADLTTYFTKLLTLSEAFMIEGTTLYQDEQVFYEIIEAFHFLIDVKKYNGDFVQGNWWDWQIGVPQRFAKALIVLDDYINPTERDKFISAIEGYIPHVTKQMRQGTTSTSQSNAFVTATGANLTDIGINVLASAIIAKDASRMQQIPDHLPSVMAVNTGSTGDGFYTDGSFVQHQELAYTGSYGIEAIRGISNIVTVIDGTQWGFDESTPNYTNLYTIIPNTFFPIVHNGMVMEMTQGRSISRAPESNRYALSASAGAELSANLLSLADYLPEDLQREIKEHVKFWYEGSKDTFDYVERARDFEMLLNMKALLKDESIEAKVNEELKVMSGMARVTNIRKDFAVGVSMTSEKIANYESINGENLYGFHTGDGMLYVYNNDTNMYGEAYWPTTDWYRLPGITTDTRTLPKSALHRQKSPGVTWVGGVSNGTNGSAGMILDKAKQDNVNAGYDLKAKKSYFFIDDQIVALGSDINGTTGASIETIVENRILNENGSNEIVFNGDQVENTLNTTVEKNDWVHLSGKDQNSSLGYYFLENVDDLNLSREYRSGSYLDINEMNGTNDLYKSHYFLMSINHGKEVSNDQYAYVMLPGLTQEETAAQAASNNISVVKNEENIHAVIDENLGVFAANIFTKENTEIDLSAYDFPVKSIKVNNAPAIVIDVTKNGELSIDVSSPNNQNEMIDVELTLKDNSVISSDDNITNINSNNDQLNFTYDSNNMRGMSNKALVSYSVSEDMKDLIADFKTEKLQLEAKNEMDYTVKSWSLVEALLEEVNKLNTRIDNNSPVSTLELKAMLKKIQETKDTLVYAGNQTELKNFIESIDKTLYTEYAQSILENKLSEVSDLYTERESQVTLDTYHTELKTLLESLDQNIDLSKYINILELYENIDVNKYKSDGVIKFTDSYRALEALVEKYDPTQALTKTVDGLENAVLQLLEDLEELELIEENEDTDPKLDALRKQAIQLVLEVSRLEKISETLRVETGVLILMIENKDITYDELLAQYNKVLELYNNNDNNVIEDDKKKEKEDSKGPHTGIESNHYIWLTTIIAGIVIVFVTLRKNKFSLK